MTRSVALRRFALALSAASLLAAAPMAAQTIQLRLVDDRQTPIDSPVKVCFYRVLETACLEQPPYVVPPQLQGFDSLTAEGPRHGPLNLKRAELASETSGPITVTVARKALVVIDGMPAALTLSLYRREDDSFRKAAWHFDPKSGSGTWVPSGSFVASLSDGRHAPQIEFLRGEPGKRYVFRYRSKPGWSVLVRCVARVTRQPVSAALVEVLSASDLETERSLGRGKPDQDGLAAINGIPEPYATLSVSADGFLKDRVRGVAAAAGSLAFREVLLSRGGNVRASVAIDGEPARGAACRLVSPHAKAVPLQTTMEERLSRAVETLWEGRVGKDGVCLAGPVEQGEYLLRLVPVGAANSSDEPVTVVDEQTAELDVRLQRLEVRGTVKKGEKPLSDVVVTVANIEDLVNSPTGRSVPPAPLMLNTDSDGRFRGFVLKRGEYSFGVVDDAWRSKASKRPVWVGDDGATVDFQISDADITGLVVDQAGNAISRAVVTLTIYKGSEWTIRPVYAQEDGRFSFSFTDPGLFKLEASKKGYRDAEPVDLTIPPDVTSVPPVTMVLSKLNSIDGRVLSISGVPLPGARVAAYQAQPGVPPAIVGEALTDSDGAFTVPAAPGSGTRLFVTGPGCPLQLADVGNDDSDKTLRCASISAGIEAVVTKANHSPIEGEYLFLRWNGNLIPLDQLKTHLGFLGLPFKTDGAGRVTLVNLPPGDYDVFVGSGSSEATIAEGLKYGYASSARLNPREVVELEIQLGKGVRFSAPAP